MKVSMLASASGSTDDSLQYVSTFIVDQVVAIDAGCLGAWKTPEDQSQIEHVFLTHTHADHVATLPIFVENVYDPATRPVVVHGSGAVLDSLKRDIFNDRVWPDFIERLAPEGRPFLELHEVRQDEAVEVAGLNITPVPVDHLVPTFAYVVDDGHASVIFGADTAPTQRLWEVAADLTNLKAVFLECAFPNDMQWLADLSGHMTPRQFALEAAKAPLDVPLVAVHIKPRYRRQTIAELSALDLPRLTIAKGGGIHEF